MMEPSYRGEGICQAQCSQEVAQLGFKLRLWNLCPGYHAHCCSLVWLHFPPGRPAAPSHLLSPQNLLSFPRCYVVLLSPVSETTDGLSLSDEILFIF